MIELHPDLQSHLRNGWITHPLLKLQYWKPGDNRRINTLYEHRLNRAQSARQSNDWDTLIALHRPTEREMAFYENCEHMERADHYRISGNIWTDPEIIRSGSCFVAGVISASDDFSVRRAIMSDNELAELDSLPDRLQIFRSHLEWNRDGFCWTLDRNIALDFAYGYDWPCLTTANIAKSDALAFFQRRGESEIIVNPSNVSDAETETVLASQ